MLNIDVGLVTGVVSILGSVGGVIAMLFRLLRRIEKVEERARRNEGANAVLLRGMFATLDGLHQQGCNGEVTAARKILEDFLVGGRME